MWILYAFGSALFAGITSILAKCGIKQTDSNVATAIRTIVVLLFAWIMVFVVGSQGTLSSISAKSLTFLILSGVATGASWLCYFRALQTVSYTHLGVFTVCSIISRSLVDSYPISRDISYTNSRKSFTVVFSSLIMEILCRIRGCVISCTLSFMTVSIPFCPQKLDFGTYRGQVSCLN